MVYLHSNFILFFSFLVCYVCDTGISEEEKCRLLHCVVVGGGPTGVEFSGELSDFIMKDVRQRYAHVKDYIHVTLIEVWLQKFLYLGFGSAIFPMVSAVILSYTRL